MRAAHDLARSDGLGTAEQGLTRRAARVGGHVVHHRGAARARGAVGARAVEEARVVQEGLARAPGLGWGWVYNRQRVR